MKWFTAISILCLLALAPQGQAQQDPGKAIVGKINVSVYYATNGDVSAAGKNASKIPDDIAKRLRKEKRLSFTHYRLLGSDTKDLFRSYENWAEPVKPSDEIMVRFEAQSAPTRQHAMLDLELWLGRKKIIKTDAHIMANKPLWVLGPEWRGGHLIIAVSLVESHAPKP